MDERYIKLIARHKKFLGFNRWSLLMAVGWGCLIASAVIPFLVTPADYPISWCLLVAGVTAMVVGYIKYRLIDRAAQRTFIAHYRRTGDVLPWEWRYEAEPPGREANIID